MAYDERLAGRVRKLLAGRKGFDEKKMFGGLCFLLNAKMVCGVLKEDLVVRIGPERYAAALARPADGFHRPNDNGVRIRQPPRLPNG